MTQSLPLPPDVPGFAEAKARGLLPTIGPEPPPPLPGVAASVLMDRWVWATIAAFSGTIVVGLLVSRAVSLTGFGAVAYALFCLAVLAAIWLFLGKVGDRVLAELQHGYTTLELQEGTFWMLATRPWRNGAKRVLWDYSGTWVVSHRTQTPLATPSARVTPPGLYPSPHHEKRWELWTGIMWSGNFHQPPYLDSP